MRLVPFLDRTPLNLSGGQQQRTALARAIVKKAGLVLLDEPLANLDYKLREELREELPRIFSRSGAIFVYATTEPSEALLLGGNTATLSEGRITQFGPTIEVFRRPRDLLTARTFADPPLNTMLLDEPLANLDYKLREELREELPRIFSQSGAIFVYATTEPSEALLLGGNTATLSEGRITQFGPTIDVFRRPRDLLTAQTFADPPLNTMLVDKKGDAFVIDGSIRLTVPEALRSHPDGAYTIGFQPHHLALTPQTADAVAATARVTVTEITGSESFVHVDFAGMRWVMLAAGIHPLKVDETVEVFIDPRHIMVFDRHGNAVETPSALAA
ncbi:MAG TPA: ATP-binding cassette domain-containing protein [Pararhizobium sp.]|nr:ATP-binding cassette domain-containing protein [Pararhizobium sp.]